MSLIVLSRSGEKVDFSKSTKNNLIYQKLKAFNLKERIVCAKRARTLRRRGEHVFRTDNKQFVWFLDAPEIEVKVKIGEDFSSMHIDVNNPPSTEKYNHAVELYHYGKLSKIIYFSLHPTEENFYRKNTSYKAFSSREEKRLHEIYKKQGYDQMDKIFARVHLTTPSSIELIEIISDEYKDVRKIYVNDVWEMYKEIDYDIKAQKFTGI